MFVIIIGTKLLQTDFMETNLFKSIPVRPVEGLNIVRIAIALVLIVHAVHGLINPADIQSLGEALSSDGFPLGVVLAWSIVLFQFISCIALIFRRLVVPACICNMAILVAGVFYVHLPNGWFVVGAGRNGIEYSVTLIACLVGILWAYWPRKT